MAERDGKDRAAGGTKPRLAIGSGRWLGAGRTLLFAASAYGAVGATAARADQYDDASRQLVELDQRLGVLGGQLRDTTQPEPNQAERRLVEAQTLFELKSYNEAATLLLDILDKHPNTRAADDATVLLGEALYQGRDLLSARRHFEMAAKRGDGSRNEQKALNRLIEISLQTGDYDKIDDYLSRLQKIPPQNQDPAVPYVRGKYMFFRDRMDDALAAFNLIGPSSPYYLQARYFVATIDVKKGDLASASNGFDAVLKLQPRNDGDKEIQDLARLAIGRILYERNQFDKAREVYETIPRQSKHWSEARYEAAWNAVKAKDYKAAYRSLDLLLLQDPDSPRAPELRLLMGNLNLRLANFYLANETFSKTRDEFEPIHAQIEQTIEKSRNDPKYIENLLGENLDKFDVGVFVPPTAVRWVKDEPEVSRMLVLASDVGELRKGIKESEDLLVRLDKAVNGGGKVGIFPDLANVRTQSAEVLNQTLDLRKKLVKRARVLANPALSTEDKAALDRIDHDRAGFEENLKDLPLTAEALKARDKSARGQTEALDKQASELNVLIASLEAEVTGLEHYAKTSGDKKVKPEDLKQPLADLRAEIDRLRGEHDRVRNEIADVQRGASVAGAAGDSERSAVVKMTELLKQESEIYARARGRIDGGSIGEFDRISALLTRADSVQGRVIEFDERVDKVADARLTVIRDRLVTEKGHLQAAATKLSSLLGESHDVGGGLAQAVLRRVSDRFYDLVVQSDVGIIDVSWGLKDQKTQSVSKLINQQKLELKSLDEDFRALLEEDSK